MSSSLSRALNLNHRNRRTFISSLFGLTALASIVTVSASALLPCPAHHGRFADGDHPAAMHHTTAAATRRPGATVVEKKPRRWIEETRPTVRPRQPDAQSQV